MKINLAALYLILILILAACVNSEQEKLSDDGVWRLGWRMIESAKADNYALAEMQLDSLLNTSKQLDYKFASEGLGVLNSLDKNEKIESILKTQSEELISRLCPSSYLQTYPACADYQQAPVQDSALQIELVKMFINDQYVRSNLMIGLLEEYGLKKEDVIPEGERIDHDRVNRIRLKEIIAEHGFPTKALVGKDGMDAVFFIIQHADGDKTWQASQLVNIEKAVANKDMDGQSYAYLYDRIKVGAGEEQRYGTQFLKVDLENKIAQLNTIEDEENLDKRRREVGTMPIDMYKRLILSNTQ